MNYLIENLRVQGSGADPIPYIDVSHALSDIQARQNHASFARRGCGKTLLLQHSSKNLPEEIQSVYLNCEDFKHHSFPNVLIEILDALFHELENNLSGWFGKKRRSRQLKFEHIAADPAEAVYRDPNRHPFIPLRATRPAPQRAFFEGKLDCGSKRSAIGVQPILLAASLPRLRKGQCSNFQQPFEEGLFLSHPRPDRIRRSL